MKVFRDLIFAYLPLKSFRPPRHVVLLTLIHEIMNWSKYENIQTANSAMTSKAFSDGKVSHALCSTILYSRKGVREEWACFSVSLKAIASISCLWPKIRESLSFPKELPASASKSLVDLLLLHSSFLFPSRLFYFSVHHAIRKWDIVSFHILFQFWREWRLKSFLKA